MKNCMAKNPTDVHIKKNLDAKARGKEHTALKKTELKERMEEAERRALERCLSKDMKGKHWSEQET